MTSDAYSLVLRFPRIDPALAEVQVMVDPALPSGQAVKGRVLGPRCHYAATVEVAYPLRPSKSGVGMSASIPEPCLWDLESPFLYQVIVEWSQESQPERRVWPFAFRTLTISKNGAHINGRRVELNGTRCAELTEEKAQVFRQAGTNLLLVDSTTDLTAADRHGLLALSWRCPFMTHSRAPSFFGHCFTLEQLEKTALIRHPLKGRGLIGVELNSDPAMPLPEDVAFVVCEERDLEKLENVSLPKIVRTTKPREQRPAGMVAWVVEES